MFFPVWGLLERVRNGTGKGEGGMGKETAVP
jgi:hypothetical protein